MEDLISNEAEAMNSAIKVNAPKYLKDALVLDISFKKVDWELNEENIEKHRDDEGGEYIDYLGAVVVRAVDEKGDFDTKIIANVDICDGLYDAIEEIEQYLNEGWPSVEVFYSTRCEAFGYGPAYEHGEDIGYILSEYTGADAYYCREHEGGMLCRVIWEQKVSDIVDFVYVDEDGCLELLDVEDSAFEMLTKYLENRTSYEDMIEWVE
jgi:hypothetical protein